MQEQPQLADTLCPSFSSARKCQSQPFPGFFSDQLTYVGLFSAEFADFVRRLEQNYQEQNKKSACTRCWGLITSYQKRMNHAQHADFIVTPKSFATRGKFLKLAKRFQKIRDNGNEVALFQESCQSIKVGGKLSFTPASTPPQSNQKDFSEHLSVFKSQLLLSSHQSKVLQQLVQKDQGREAVVSSLCEQVEALREEVGLLRQEVLWLREQWRRHQEAQRREAKEEQGQHLKCKDSLFVMGQQQQQKQMFSTNDTSYDAVAPVEEGYSCGDVSMYANPQCYQMELDDSSSVIPLSQFFGQGNSILMKNESSRFSRGSLGSILRKRSFKNLNSAKDGRL